jgi:hypothetical protein
MLRRAFAVIVFACACHNERDLGFDIVKVPLSAYADAAPKTDAGAVAKNDAGHELVVMCIPKPEEKSDDDTDDKAQDDDDCPKTHADRNYDPRATERHRKNPDEGSVCCYRHGRVAPKEPETDND